MTRLATAPPELLTVKEAAQRARCSESTIWRWMADDRLPYVQHAPGGQVLIRADNLTEAKVRSERAKEGRI